MDLFRGWLELFQKVGACDNGPWPEWLQVKWGLDIFNTQYTDNKGTHLYRYNS